MGRRDMTKENEAIRKHFEQALKNSGLKQNVVARRCGLKANHLSNWKCSKLNFGEANLLMMQKFIEKYKEPIDFID